MVLFFFFFKKKKSLIKINISQCLHRLLEIYLPVQFFAHNLWKVLESWLLEISQPMWVKFPLCLVTTLWHLLHLNHSEVSLFPQLRSPVECCRILAIHAAVTFFSLSSLIAFIFICPFPPIYFSFHSFSYPIHFVHLPQLILITLL